jgi:hypothetical protein
MDDDQDGGSGLGGLAWYQMGRWSAESSQRTRDLMARLGGYGPVARADYNRVVDLNHQLTASNRHLDGELALANTWLAQWHAKCDRLEAQTAKDAQRIAELQKRAQRLEAEREAAEIEAEEFKMDIIAGKLIRVED